MVCPNALWGYIDFQRTIYLAAEFLDKNLSIKFQDMVNCARCYEINKVLIIRIPCRIFRKKRNFHIHRAKFIYRMTTE